jgi:CRISPR-associated endoribonuclease Cas6
MRYHYIRIRFKTAKAPPYFVGSQIRGALGFALKKVVCIHPSQECQGCFAAENCLFYEWYEKTGVYHLYRLDIELGKPYYDVGIYLFAEATEKLPYVVSALHRMLTVTGLGIQHEKIPTYELFVDGIRANNPEGKITLPDTPPQTVALTDAPAPKRLRLRLITPLRIKHDNRFVRSMEHLHLHSIVNSIHQRYLQLTDAPVAKLGYRVEGEITDRFGVFDDVTRYSMRNKGKLQIGGMVGEMTIEGIDDRSYRLLKLGETIGAGKQTVFGLGKIQVDTI